MGFTFERLHHVQIVIPVGGEDAARRYYGDVLGMTELVKPPTLAARGGCWFRGGSWEVHLSPVPDFVASARAHPGVLVNGLETLAAVLEAAGRPVQWDPHFPGHRRLYSRDDHGNRLEFLEAIKD
jgi:catechol 2,3-dioxygenase-like lactoylglutathione lyase family enzyme